MILPLLVVLVCAGPAAAGPVVQPVRLTAASAPSVRIQAPAALKQPASLPGLHAPDRRATWEIPAVRWEEPEQLEVGPMEYFKTGWANLEPRRKIGFLRQGESEIFEPTQWMPRRKIGFLRQGESPLWDYGSPTP